MKEIVFSDLERIQKQFELCGIYKQYQENLHKNGFFDFEDMLLDTVGALEKNPELKYNLQEKYLYILVDEFQDTNGVQMRLIDQLTNSEVNEGKPNILAVGDDDQSIYKFQGANIDNIMDFSKKFISPEIIVLQKNYRSTQQILDFIRRIILTGENRLENRLPEQIKKELYAENKNIAPGQIAEKEFPTTIHELVWIAEMIREFTKNKAVDPSEIAVIAPKHFMLEEIAGVLDFYGIQVAYSRKKNLLELPHIKDLINILKFINSLAGSDQSEADYLLPEILSSPFWGLDKLDIWKLSVRANRERKLWLEISHDGENDKLHQIASFLINLGVESRHKNADEIIDLITGVSSELANIDEDGLINEPDPFSQVEDTSFHSPYKKYYFDKAKFETSRLEYMELLQSLQAFMDKLRKYKGVGAMNVSEVIDFVGLHEKHKLALYYESRFNSEEKAVNLLTAHGAKGLEFSHVFVTNCQEDCWVRNRIADKLSFPSNLPLAPESENIEDKLRLFYVALSRAKEYLFLTRHQYNDKGDEQLKLRFLQSGDSGKGKRENISLENVDQMKEDLIKDKGLDRFIRIRTAVEKHQVNLIEEEELLKGLLQDYKLSVTHLNNFLNVAESGPQFFLEQNLLRFPQAMGAAMAYGSATHQALNQFSEQLKKTKVIPEDSFLLEKFKKSLEDQRLNKTEFNNYLEKGFDELKIYYEKRKNDFSPLDQSEFDFRGQGVSIDNAQITGKIDKMRYIPESREILVYDYKTGKVLKDFDHGYDYEKIKAWKYKNQLIFYKLLVENSRDFKGRYRVNSGILEFLTPVNNDIKLLRLDIDESESEKMKRVIRVVYDKIMNLDFPDVSFYDKSYEGIQSFIDDLIAT